MRRASAPPSPTGTGARGARSWCGTCHDGADLSCDVTDPAQIDAALVATLARGGDVPTEITVTAGIGHSGMLTDIDRDEWDRVMAVNVAGPWLVMRAWARVYAEQ